MNPNEYICLDCGEPPCDVCFPKRDVWVRGVSNLTDRSRTQVTVWVESATDLHGLTRGVWLNVPTSEVRVALPPATIEGYIAAEGNYGEDDE